MNGDRFSTTSEPAHSVVNKQSLTASLTQFLSQTNKVLADTEGELKKCRYALKERDFIPSVETTEMALKHFQKDTRVSHTIEQKSFL